MGVGVDEEEDRAGAVVAELVGSTTDSGSSDRSRQAKRMASTRPRVSSTRRPSLADGAARASVNGFRTSPSLPNTALRNCCWRSTRPRSAVRSGCSCRRPPRRSGATARRRAPGARRAGSAPASRHVEARVRVVGRVREVDRDATQRVDEPGEADEVDLEVVVDRDAERLLDREHEPAWAAVVGGVDLAGAVGLGDRDVEVAGDRHHLRLAVHEPQQQHRVRALPAAVLEGRPGSRPASARSADVAGVGPDDQVVRAVAPRGEHVGQRDLVDLVVDRPGVEPPAERAQQQQDGQEQRREQEHAPQLRAVGEQAAALASVERLGGGRRLGRRCLGDRCRGPRAGWGGRG